MTENENDFPPEEVPDGGADALGEMDFNVEDEYKPEPLIPKGTYHAVANKISFVPAQSCIVWEFCLHDNGGVMNDGQTPVDGAHVFVRNWLPKPGDENERTKSGRNNKRQSKINMLKDFQETLQLDMSTPAKIAMALNEQTWIGTEADLTVNITEYQGKFRNEVSKVGRSSLFS